MPNNSTVSLPCQLTDVETLAFATTLAQKQSEIEANEDARRASASQFKSQNDILVAEIRELSRKIRDGFENRDVDCIETFVWAENIVRSTRLDTGEEMWNRPINDTERQQHLDLADESTLSPEQQELRERANEARNLSEDILGDSEP